MLTRWSYQVPADETDPDSVVNRGRGYEVLRDHLWNKVREDGRLVSRGNCGIKVHAAAAVSGRSHMLGAGEADVIR